MRSFFKKLFFTLLIAILAFSLIPPSSFAKKKKKTKTTAQMSPSEQRIAGLNPDEKRQFESLTKKQQKFIRQGRIEVDFNAWMVKLAVGNPFYTSEHHPVYTDYEEVWLYTMPRVKEDVQERRIIDRQTNWPSIHRVTKKETCYVGDYFLLYNRGIVEKIVHAKPKRHGKCTLETTEAILPIVDGKPVEPKTR